MMRASRTPALAATAIASSVLLGTAVAAPASALPVAAFEINRASPHVNRLVKLDGTASTCDVPPCSYTWRWYRPTTPSDFDRLGTSMGIGEVIKYAWTTPGDKIVVLTVTASNSTHGKGSAAKQITVRP